MNLKNYEGLPEAAQRILALIALILLSPVLLITIVLIKVESKGPILFSQVRVGEQGRRFLMYKFRSMYQMDDPKYIDPATMKSDRDGVCNKYYNDPRITKVGRVIRKLSIDELPQLINVLKGDMVLIGPRPALPQETERYQWYMLERFNAKSGLTGLWQVSGRADTTFEQQIELDIQYVRERSLWLDLKIILITVPTVLLGKGAY